MYKFLSDFIYLIGVIFGIPVSIYSLMAESWIPIMIFMLLLIIDFFLKIKI